MISTNINPFVAINPLCNTPAVSNKQCRPLGALSVMLICLEFALSYLWSLPCTEVGQTTGVGEGEGRLGGSVGSDCTAKKGSMSVNIVFI